MRIIGSRAPTRLWVSRTRRRKNLNACNSYARNSIPGSRPKCPALLLRCNRRVTSISASTLPGRLWPVAPPWPGGWWALLLSTTDILPQPPDYDSSSQEFLQPASVHLQPFRDAAGYELAAHRRAHWRIPCFHIRRRQVMRYGRASQDKATSPV